MDVRATPAPYRDRPVSASRVRLPADVTSPFEVYRNGVLQTPGRDYRVDGGTLLFTNPLAHEGRLGFWRWLSILLGFAGTYRKHDNVDVTYVRDGRRTVATGLPLLPDEPA